MDCYNIADGNNGCNDKDTSSNNGSDCKDDVGMLSF